jgi:hypothetical protein
MCGRLLDAAGVSLVISGFIEPETAAITSFEYHPPADGNTETCNVDGTPMLALVVGRGTTLDIMPRR